MAKKEIRIHLAADADIAKVRAMNTELARMAMAVGRKNDDLRQSTMRAAREYYGLADAADMCATRSVLSAKQIEEAWRKAMSRPAENAERGLKKFEIAAKGALKGIGGAFSSVFGMFLQGGIWGAAAEAVTRVFSWACNKIKEDAERAAKRAARAFAEGLDEIRKSAAVVEKAFESSVSGIEKSISRFDAMTNSVKELTKAEIELAKQRAISNGMDAASANAAAEDLSAQVDFEAEELRLRNVIALEQKRVDAAKAAEAATAEEVRKATEAKAAAEAEYQKKRKAAAEKAATEARFAVNPFTSGAPVTEEDIARAKVRGAEKFDESDAGSAAREKVRKAQDVLDGIKTDEKARAAGPQLRRAVPARPCGRDRAFRARVQGGRRVLRRDGARARRRHVDGAHSGGVLPGGGRVPLRGPRHGGGRLVHPSGVVISRLGRPMVAGRTELRVHGGQQGENRVGRQDAV